MKNVITIILVIFTITIRSQSLYFPPLLGSSWDTLSPSALGWCPDKLDTLNDFLDKKNSKGFIIIKDGKIVLEWYFDTFTKDSLWYWASAGKTITSLLTGIAQEEGYLNITDTTSKYLGSGWTDCTMAQEEKITIWNQLTMTSGLDDGVPDNYCTLDSCLIYIADPGTRWAYHNAPYTLLDDVIFNSTGNTLNNYYTQKIGSKIGAYGLFIPSGYNNVFYSTTRSMTKFGLLILAKGIWNGNPIINDTTYFNAMINTSQNLNKSYGYLWWLNGKGEYMLPGLQYVFTTDLVPNAPNDMFAALGKNDQKIYVIPSKNMVVVRMGESSGSSALALSSFDNDLWQKINDLDCSLTSVSKTEKHDYQTRIFPNPTSSLIEIKSEKKIKEIHIENIYGNKIMFYSDINWLDISHLPSGIYHMNVLFNDNSLEYLRIVKQ